jgi:hypothetical protein
MIQLSILIPTLPERKSFFNQMRDSIINRCPFEYLESIEILSDDRPRGVTTGEKRNDLVSRAQGKYVWHVDDDDELAPYAIAEVYEATLQDPDVVCFNGYMTTDGKNRVDWEIRLGHPYDKTYRDGKEYYLRFPNHISPMKREHAIRVKFPAKTHGEDYAFAKELNDLGLLKTQVIIEKPIYHYKYRSKK